MIDSNRPQDRLREKVTETRENIADMGHLAKETVQDKVHELKEKAVQGYDDGKEKLRELGTSLVTMVRESPMKSVLIASGIGLVLGVLWRRK